MKSQRRFSEVSVVLCLVTMSSQVLANPVGESLRAGRARFDRSAPGSLTIQQDTDRLIINWRDFSIAAGETTRFLQPSATSIALNRVVSANPSRLFGNLEANGKVYLLNPNGILVGRGGAVNTRGFVASTLDVSDASFLSSAKLNLSGDSTASVVNEGSIRAIGGDVFLVGRTVENSGSIRASTVGLGAGSEVVIVPTGRERLSVIAGNPNGAPADKGVNNSGSIEAVSAELKAAGGNIYALAINNGGIIRATGVRREGGRVFLSSDGGDIENSGAIVANNASGSGGFVSLAGGHNAANPSTVFNTGTIEARGDSAGAKGGEVRLTGDYVGLFGASVIDVSGQSGGGAALIGGDYHGANPEIQNALRTSVGPNAVIRADALSSGNGGKVILWADEVTRFYGSISAQGGQASGNGGFVETSGKLSLEFRGSADLSAVHGRFGMLLLDPQDVVIADVDASPGSADDAEIADATINGTDGSGTFTISRGALEAISGTADILIEATDTITINALGGDDTLNLLTGTGHSVTFRADSDNNGTGNFTMDINDGIETLGGSVTIIGNSLDIGDIVTTGGGAPGGAVVLRGNEMTFDNTTTIVAGSGNVTYEPKTAGTAITLGAGTGGLNITETDLNKVTTSGLFQIGSSTAGNITVDTDIDLGAKDVALVTGGTINFGTGDTLTTTGNATLTAGTGIPGDNGTTAHVDADIVTLQVTGTGTIGTDASNPFRISANELVATTAGSVGDDIFVTEASTLTALDVNAGAANVTLRLAEGSLSDSDASVDIVANAATITLSDANDNGDDFGSLANPIGTSVNALTVTTSAGTTDGSQFITEANGLTALNLDAGGGDVNLTLTLGGVADTDGAADITAASATVILSDATAQDFGALANAINTSVGSLSVDSSAGGGSQFITEANGLTALNLNAGAGDVTLALTLGALTDTDGAADIIAASAAVTLSDATAQDFGASGNHIDTIVNDLSVNTSAGGGDQFITEANGLIGLNLNAGAGDVNLTLTLGAIADLDGAADITAANATVILSDATAQGFGALANAINTSVGGLSVNTSAGGGDQFITEASGLTGLNLNAGAGDVNLTLTLGAVTDTDGGADITADQAFVTLLAGAAQDFGAVGNRIGTSVNELSVNTSAGGGDQFITEANGLTALDLNAGAGDVNLTLTLGALTDTDALADITAANATVILSDATAQGFGALANAINTSVGGLSVNTSAGGGDQFITEGNDLTGLNLNAGAGNVNLVVTLGSVLDTDPGTDITANQATVSLLDATAQAFGTSGDEIGTSVNILTVNSAAGGGDQFITEANGLTALDLNAGGGNVNLTLTAGTITDTDGATDITAVSAVVTLSGDFGATGAGNAIQTDVDSLSVNSGNGDQFIEEADGLTGLNLAAGAGAVNLTLLLGGITDTDGGNDITAGSATVVLNDPTAQAFGTLANAINTSVGGLSVNTSTGGGDQFITEANGLTGLDLNAGGGDVNLTVTLGAVTDADGTADITADQATVNLLAVGSQDFGASGSHIGTSVNDLSVNTSAGGGDQFITEANGLTALNLNAGAGDVTLALTLGNLLDTDVAADITAANATVTLSGTFGASGLNNAINTSVGGLSVDTSAGNGDQFIVEANGLTGLNLNAGAGDVNLTLTLGALADTDGATDLTADQATVTLSEAAVRNFGAVGNRIATSVNDLSVITSAGGGSQFITEANGLTALNLNAGAGNVDLTLALGAVADTDVAADITAANAVVVLSEAAAQDFGTAANAINTTVDNLSVNTSAGGGSQFIREASVLTGLNLNAGAGNVNLSLTAGSLVDSDAATDIAAATANVTVSGPADIGTAVNPIGISASGATVGLSAAGGGVHVDVAAAGNVQFQTPGAGVTASFLHSGVTTYNLNYANNLTVKANGNIDSGLVGSLLVPGTLTLNAVGSIGGSVAAPMKIDAATLNASAGSTISLSDPGSVVLGTLTTPGGNIFVQAGNTLTFNGSTVINAGAGTAILVADGAPGVNVIGSPTVSSRFLLYALNAETTVPPVVLVGSNPTIGGLVADRIDSPLNFNPLIPDPFADALDHFVFSLEANPPTDPSLYIDIPVEVFQPVSIVFGDYDPTKFGEVGDLWMSSSELYEIERKAGKARKALPPQVGRAKYTPEGK